MPKNVVKYPLEESLRLYAQHLQSVVFDNVAEFDRLSRANYLGCFCKDVDKCHTGVIIQYMREQYPGRTTFPRHQCVKVNELRKVGYDNLRDWMSVDGNVLVTRNGRVPIKGEGVFAYPKSMWANPYPVAM